MQLETDALKDAAAWPGVGQRTPVVLASQLMAAERYQGRPRTVSWESWASHAEPCRFFAS